MSNDTLITAMKRTYPERTLRITHYNKDKLKQEGLDSRKLYRGANYLTLVEWFKPTGESLVAEAVCCHKDQPIRKRGLEIALHRMIKKAGQEGWL